MEYRLILRDALPLEISRLDYFFSAAHAGFVELLASAELTERPRAVKFAFVALQSTLNGFTLFYLYDEHISFLWVAKSREKIIPSTVLLK